VHFCSTLVPGHPLRRRLLDPLAVPLQLVEVVERIGTIELAGVDQAHIQVTHTRPLPLAKHVGQVFASVLGAGEEQRDTTLLKDSDDAAREPSAPAKPPSDPATAPAWKCRRCAPRPPGPPDAPASGKQDGAGPPFRPLSRIASLPAAEFPGSLPGPSAGSMGIRSHSVTTRSCSLPSHRTFSRPHRAVRRR